jgi:hypothetical protein
VKTRKTGFTRQIHERAIVGVGLRSAALRSACGPRLPADQR